MTFLQFILLVIVLGGLIHYAAERVLLRLHQIEARIEQIALELDIDEPDEEMAEREMQERLRMVARHRSTGV